MVLLSSSNYPNKTNVTYATLLNIDPEVVELVKLI